MIFFAVNNKNNNNFFINHLKTRNPKTGSLENSEDQEEMPNIVAIYQGLHSLPDQIDMQKKKYKFFWNF